MALDLDQHVLAFTRDVGQPAQRRQACPQDHVARPLELDGACIARITQIAFADRGGRLRLLRLVGLSERCQTLCFCSVTFRFLLSLGGYLSFALGVVFGRLALFAVVEQNRNLGIAITLGTGANFARQRLSQCFILGHARQLDMLVEQRNLTGPKTAQARHSRQNARFIVRRFTCADNKAIMDLTARQTLADGCNQPCTSRVIRHMAGHVNRRRRRDDIGAIR